MRQKKEVPSDGSLQWRMYVSSDNRRKIRTRVFVRIFSRQICREMVNPLFSLSSIWIPLKDPALYPWELGLSGFMMSLCAYSYLIWSSSRRIDRASCVHVDSLYVFFYSLADVGGRCNSCNSATATPRPNPQSIFLFHFLRCVSTILASIFHSPLIASPHIDWTAV